jgi:hypothetical protein
VDDMTPKPTPLPSRQLRQPQPRPHPAAGPQRPRFCNHCGAPWDPALDYCPHCARVGGRPPARPAPRRTVSGSRALRAPLSLYFVLLAISGLTIILFQAEVI